MDVFIRLPWRIYVDDPHWVPPLLLERRAHFSPRFNPFLRHAEWQAWIALQDGEPVGRICAHVDEVHRDRYGGHTGHFGLIEGRDDSGLFAALLSAAEAWLAERGTRYVTGPYNFSINQECGVLVDGFDTPPMVLMPHARQWYGRRIEEQGYGRARDLLAYWIDTDFRTTRVMRALSRRFASRVTLRTLHRDDFAGELETLRDIFNDAWSKNWGFIPFSREEFADLGASLRHILPDEFIQIAEVDGEAAAFVVVLPNLNEVLKELDGSLLPTGWLRIVKALRQRRIRTARVPLMGVRSKYQNTPLGVMLAFLVCDTARYAAADRGITGVELSWILDNNKGMRSILDDIESPEYKRYRIYEKQL